MMAHTACQAGHINFPHPSTAGLAASHRKLPRPASPSPPSLHFLNIPVSTGNCSLLLPVIVKQKAEGRGKEEEEVPAQGDGCRHVCEGEREREEPLTANHSSPQA